MRYHPFYCEENVWWLAQEPRFASLRREVVLVSNERRTCAMFHQRAASAPEAAVLWDYHVVLAVTGAGGVEVWDFDCILGAPLPALSWLDASFGPEGAMVDAYRPLFRLVDADEYVATLCSDREHMRGPDGVSLESPPAWPCIGRGAPNLARFTDLRDPFIGERVDRPALAERWRLARGLCGSLSRR